MHYFIMKAQSHDKSWYTFDLADIPTLVAPNQFALLGKPGSPILDLKSIKRGDRKTGLFEGDILLMDGTKWVVCYERGFYAISEDYVTRYLYQLKDYKVIGDYFKDGFSTPINVRTKHLFKYKGNIFRLEDIVGGSANEYIILRSCSHVVKIEDIQQECCMTYDGTRIFFGDVFPEGTVELCGGRVCFDFGGQFIELVNGGVIDGCYS